MAKLYEMVTVLCVTENTFVDIKGLMILIDNLSERYWYCSI